MEEEDKTFLFHDDEDDNKDDNKDDGMVFFASNSFIFYACHASSQRPKESWSRY